jgi:hypothetical protein
MRVLDPNDVCATGQDYGWYEHAYQWAQGELVILRKVDSNEDTMQLNVWCTTGTVGSYLTHPVQGKTQLFRRAVDNLCDLCAILENPRVHTGDGYHRKPYARSPAQQERTVPCPGCGRMFKVMSSVAGHFESGSCQACPGRDAARQAVYGFVRKQEQHTGRYGALTGNTLLTWSGQADYTAGYDADGQNYECPGCRKAFRTLQGLMSHCEAKPQCRSGNGMLQLTFR